MLSRFFWAGVVGATLILLSLLFASHQARAESPPHVYQIYLVKEGDTLAGIAKRFGVSIRAIRTANKLKSARVRPGQRLKIPLKKRTPRTSAPCGREYRVRQGDTIRRIARRCGVSASALRSTNGLRLGQRLRAGQILRIPDMTPRAYLPPPARSR